MILLRKPRVVIDTNVFISGYLFGGNPEKVINLFKENKIDLLISPETQAELFQKLAEFEVPTNKIGEIDESLKIRSVRLIPENKSKKSRDAKDNMFIDLAIEGKADYIITGDSDLLDLKTVENTAIVRPKEFLGKVK